MTPEKQIFKAYHVLQRLYREQMLFSCFKSIWFWGPLFCLNYSEWHFQTLGILYVGIIFFGIFFFKRIPLTLSHSAYYLDHYGQTQGEFSAWYEFPTNPFAPLLLKRIETYSFQKFPRFPWGRLCFWVLPLFILITYPLFRSEERWRLSAEREILLKKTKQMSSLSDPVSQSVQSDLKKIEQLLAHQETDIEKILAELQAVKTKAKQQISFSEEEQKLLQQLLKKFPQLQEFLQDQKEVAQNLLEKEKIEPSLQEKILQYDPKQLEKALQTSQHIHSPLFTVLDALFPEHSHLPQKTAPTEDELLSKLEQKPLIWPEQTSPESVSSGLRSPRFLELLQHLEKTGQ